MIVSHPCFQMMSGASAQSLMPLNVLSLSPTRTSSNSSESLCSMQLADKASRNDSMGSCFSRQSSLPGPLVTSNDSKWYCPLMTEAVPKTPSVSDHHSSNRSSLFDGTWGSRSNRSSTTSSQEEEVVNSKTITKISTGNKAPAFVLRTQAELDAQSYKEGEACRAAQLEEIVNLRELLRIQVKK